MYMTLSLKPLYSEETRYQSVLAVLFVIYLMSNMVLPPSLTKLVNTQAGMVVVVLVALTIFFHTHPVVGVLALLVAYEMIRTASRTTPAEIYSEVQPSYRSREDRLRAMQPTPRVTLEEEMVKNLIPFVRPAADSDQGPSYLPVLDNNRNASKAV